MCMEKIKFYKDEKFESRVVINAEFVFHRFPESVFGPQLDPRRPNEVVKRIKFVNNFSPEMMRATALGN